MVRPTSGSSDSAQPERSLDIPAGNIITLDGSKVFAVGTAYTSLVAEIAEYRAGMERIIPLKKVLEDTSLVSEYGRQSLINHYLWYIRSQRLCVAKPPPQSFKSRLMDSFEFRRGRGCENFDPTPPWSRVARNSSAYPWCMGPSGSTYAVGETRQGIKFLKLAYYIMTNLISVIDEYVGTPYSKELYPLVQTARRVLALRGRDRGEGLLFKSFNQISGFYLQSSRRSRTRRHQSSGRAPPPPL